MLEHLVDMEEFIMKRIEQRVHELYWNEDVNCASTMLICLGELFDIKIEPQTLRAAAGMHGAGGFRAQCGLVEGALMFLGIYSAEMVSREESTASLCYQYAEAFENKFGSLKCFDLRPGGFLPNDPPHRCETITCEAVNFAYTFISSLSG